MCRKHSLPSDDSLNINDGIPDPLRTSEIERSLMLRQQRQFREMQEAFASTGGLVTGDVAAGLLRGRCNQPVSLLARWVVDRTLVAFEWRSCLLVPLFQFEEGGQAIRPCVTAAVRELADAFTDWEVAAWFAQPNTWLLNRAPCDAIGLDPDQVLQAARADRFIAMG